MRSPHHHPDGVSVRERGLMYDVVDSKPDALLPDSLLPDAHLPLDSRLQVLAPRTSFSRSARKSTEDFSTKAEETPGDMHDEPLLRDMKKSAWQSGGWPTRRMILGVRACFIGLGGGTVSAIYRIILDESLEAVWKKLGPLTVATMGWDECPWVYIVLACSVLGACTGGLIKLLGAPTANLPGVVLEVHRDGHLSNDVGQMVPISLCSIVAGGSLGPEAPLISIGGGLASQYALWCGLSEAETLILTMCGMGAGLAAFFGDPVGGALFACEVLHRQGLEYYEAVVPTITAGLASNLAFRAILNIESTPIVWHFPTESLLTADGLNTSFTRCMAVLSINAPGLLYGCLGAIVAIIWMKGLNAAKRSMEPWAHWHLLKGAIGGLLIGLIGAVAPQVLFWGELEAQTLLDGKSELPHVYPQIGITGQQAHAFGAAGLFAVSLLKLLAINITILAGYRGGFIFPLMNAGIGIGSAIAMGLPLGTVSLSEAALSFAAAITTAVTRTVLATPLVLTSLTGRVELFPMMLIASIVSLHLTSHVAVITQAQQRSMEGEYSVTRRDTRMEGESPTRSFKIPSGPGAP